MGHYHQGGSKPRLEQLVHIPSTSLTICFFVHDDSSPLFRCEAMRLPSAFCLHDHFGWRTRKTPSTYADTLFVSDLVLAKPGTISKRLGKLLLSARLLTGRIVHRHVAIIMKPSPHYVITESTISGHDVVLLPGLLPIFLHGCKIKSGWGLGTRLGWTLVSWWVLDIGMGPCFVVGA